MKKVVYRERIFIDRYSCIDKPITRYYISSWVVGGLTYFKENQFNIFCVATEDILNID